MSLENLFHSMDATYIRGLVERNESENLYIEYKSGVTFNDNNILKNKLSKALSGFANAAGGIVIWGVSEDKQQKIFKLDYVDQPEHWLHRLNDLTPTRTSPIVDGVLHREVAFEDGKSCIITYIPKSDSAPHMDIVSKLYHKRSGSSHVPMEHFDLEDMFGRRQKPKLEILIKVTHSPNCSLEFTVTNTGRASATNIAVILEFKNATVTNHHQNFSNISGLNSGRHVLNFVDHTYVLHPNFVDLLLGEVTLTLLDNPTIQVSWVAENFKARKETLALPSITRNTVRLT